MRNVSELDGNAYITNSSFPAPGDQDRLLRVMFETPDVMVIDVQAYRKGRYDGFPPFACLYVNVATVLRLTPCVDCGVRRYAGRNFAEDCVYH